MMPNARITFKGKQHSIDPDINSMHIDGITKMESKWSKCERHTLDGRKLPSHGEDTPLCNAC
jgi:hypothetical protein